jgi:hypothetical protein
MTPEDAPTPRGTPRFVPTLTEVVDTGNEGEPATPPPPAAAPALDADAVAAALLARIGPGLERQISETIARVVHEQMLGLSGRVQKALAEVAREAVAQALARGEHESG